jgi:hypothetical protein
MKKKSNDNPTLPVEIQFQINGGTTYYYFNNQQLVAQVQPKTGAITAPDISVINNLQTQYKNYTYQDYTSAQNTFGSHLGKNGLGYNQKFSITFNAPVKLETVTIWWKMDIEENDPFQWCYHNPDMYRIGLYRYIGEDKNASWTTLGCIFYNTTGIAWALPPTNGLLASFQATANLMFTPDQTTQAMPAFKDNSGWALQGSGSKFSVEMTRYSFI